MNKGLLRTLGAIFGVVFILLAVPIGNLDRGSWAPWIVMASFFGFGAALLIYATTGRSTILYRTDDKEHRP